MITRRSFITSLSAAFATSVMAGPCSTSDSEVNWDYFTDFDAMRWDLSAPWLVKSKTVATDGRILFSANELCPLLNDATDTPKPKIEVLPWDKFNEISGWQSSDSIVRCKPTYKSKYDCVQPCANCKGTGRVGSVVKKTRVRDECGDLYETWVGGLSCDVCKGEVWIKDGFVFKAAEAKFAAHYVERIKTMGEFDFVIDQIPEGCEENLADVMLFRNAHGCGFLMGLDL